jgi:enhancer of mRNA-decapping protein 3
MIAKDDACFGTPVERYMDEEFDFEKNLALFDKRAVFQELTANQKSGPVKRQLYFRHDESVLRMPNEDNYHGINGRSENQKISG